MNWLSDPNPWLLAICSGLVVNLVWAFIWASIKWIRLPETSGSSSIGGSTRQASFPEFTLRQLPLIVFGSLIVLPVSGGIIYLYIQIYRLYETQWFIASIWIGLLILSGCLMVMANPRIVGAFNPLEALLMIGYWIFIAPWGILILILVFGSPVILGYFLDIFGFKGWANSAIADVVKMLENFHESMRK